MPLTAGARLGPYEIVSLIGKGGMGEVYRARDTKLDRDVAIKVLPEELAADTERGARFEREAKLVASLNHPNIGGIYGLEESGGVKALVLELVEGPTLADRIAQGPIPIDEALPIARQIAEALEAGHEAGIVHRDLKPANVKVKDDGTVKVLDYGLAKGIEDGARNGGDSELSQSPTLTRQGTQLGVILGTAPYMSPEQAKGKRVDKRTDIFAFGAVVYEMLTGKRAFAGEDVSETLAHVMMKDPDWEALPPATPGALRQVLRLCLTKNARERVRDIADVRLAMGGAFETETEATSQPRVAEPSGWRPYLLGALVGALTLAAGASIVEWNLEPEIPHPVTRFTISLPAPYTAGARRGQLLALSPDGRRVAFSDAGQIYIRDMDQTEMTPVPGTEGAIDPFFSPDGASVGFWSEGEIKKAPVAGGATVTVCKAQVLHGVRWEADDTIVFGQTSGIYRVSANGGTAELLVPMEGTGKTAHGPQVLPGGKELLLTLGTSGNWDDAEIVVHSLETDESKVVVERGRDARYVPSGHLVYFIDGTLIAVPFDVDALEVTGGAVPIAENIVVPFSTTASAFFGVSDSGSLVYAENVREDRRTLVWVDRDGKEEALAATPRGYSYPRISPDGSRVALWIGDLDDIWIWDFARETLTRFTFDPLTDVAPIWTPDGQQIVFESHREGDGSVFMKPARGTGAAVRLTRDPRHQTPLSISPDGTSLLIEDRGASVQYDVALVALPGGGDAELLVHSEFNETDAAFAPDGRFFAYASDESGRYEVYVRPFPNVEDGLWQVSRDGGVQPLWSRDGRELFYASPDGKLMGLSVRTGDDFTYGNPEVVVATPHAQLRPSVVGYDISPDGRRFLMLEEVESSTTELFVVLNWAEELRRAAPTGN